MGIFGESGAIFGRPSKERKPLPYSIRDTLYGNANGKCERCGKQLKSPGCGEIHHKDGDRTNDNMRNLMLVCPDCHNKFTRERRLKAAKAKIKKRTKGAESGLFSGSGIMGDGSSVWGKP